MNTLKITLKSVIVLTLLLLVACASPMKSYQKGNYLTACEQAVKKLQQSPANAEAREVLAKAYPKVLEEVGRETDSLTFENIEENAEVITFLERWNKLIDKMNITPAALEIIPNPDSYKKELSELKEYTAQIAYDAGEKYMTQPTVDNARLALKYFTTADQYEPGYKEVKNKIKEAREAATLKVLIMDPMLPVSYRWGRDFFYRNWIDNLNHRTYGNLVHFYPFSEMSSQQRPPDQQIDFNFQSFTMGIPNTMVQEEVVSREIPVGTNVVNGVEHTIYETVSAQFIYHRVELITSGRLEVRITDYATRKFLHDRTFYQEFVWVSEWATFSGDPRALNSQQQFLVGRHALPLPMEQDVYDTVLKQLKGDVVRYLSMIY